MKVKTVKRFHDMEMKKVREKDEVFNVSEKRAKYLVEQGMVMIIKEKTVEKEVAEKKEEE